MRHFTKNIHLIGIGGAGMSPLAEVLVGLGHRVTGSDYSESSTTKRLESLGISIQYNHIPHLIKTTDLVVYSSAVRLDNPERQYAVEHSIRQVRRAELFGDLMRGYYAVCIAGTHGKTTTTALVSTILYEAGMDPTVLAGGHLRSIDSHALKGNSSIMVVEADEYDRSFLEFFPSIAILTNIEADHLDCYKDLNDIKETFIQFTQRVPFYGAVIACKDDPGVADILPHIDRNVITYGLNESADYSAVDISFVNGKGSFTIKKGQSTLGTCNLSIPGNHNILNALAASICAHELGVPFKQIQDSLQNFKGVSRRFETIAQVKNITIIDDYAHHPGEISATLDAARKCGFKKVTAVFQPHLYSRTRDFLNDFALSLSKADRVVLTSIYKSREEPIPGINSELLLESVKKNGFKDAVLINNREEIPEYLVNDLQDGEVVVFMGAGNIREQAEALAGVLQNG